MALRYETSGKSFWMLKYMVTMLKRVVIPRPTRAGADSNLIQKASQLTKTQNVDGLNNFYKRNRLKIFLTCRFGRKCARLCGQNETRRGDNCNYRFGTEFRKLNFEHTAGKHNSEDR